MSWLITVLLAAASLAVLLPALLLLLAVIDHPRTEEGWRRELASTGGFEHRVLLEAYRICHYKKGKSDVKKDTQEAHRTMAGNSRLYAENSTSARPAGRRPGRHFAQQGNDDDYYEFFRRSETGIHRSEVSDSHGRPGSADSTTPSRPADQQDKDRPAGPESSGPAGEPIQTGSGGRSGGTGAGSEPAAFWEKLVENGKRLGV